MKQIGLNEILSTGGTLDLKASDLKWSGETLASKEFIESTSGAAAASIADGNGRFTASTIEGALDEVKAIADNNSLGLGAFWAEVELAADVNIVLSGEQSIDGVTTSGSRVLLETQTDASENGIYVTGAGAWTRAVDADGDVEFTPNKTVFVSGGLTDAGHTYAYSGSNAPTVGTDDLVFDLKSETIIIAGSIGATQLGTDSVTNGKIAPDAIDGSHIADASIGSEHIAAGALQIDDTNGLQTALDTKASNDDVSLKVNSADLASVANGAGASLTGVEDSAGYFTGTTVEAVLAELSVSTTADKVSSDAGIATNVSDIAALDVRVTAEELKVIDLETFEASSTSDAFALTVRVTTAEGEIDTLQSNSASMSTLVDTKVAIADLASTTVGKGASQIGVQDVDGHFTATTVEGVLDEIQEGIDGIYVTYSALVDANTALTQSNDADIAALDVRVTTNEVDISAKTEVSDLFSTNANKGASLVGLQDTAGYYASSTVEGALGEIAGKILDANSKKYLIATVDFSSGGVQEIGSIPAGSKILTVRFNTETLWDGTTPLGSIGVSGSASSLMTTAELDLTALEYSIKEVYVPIATTTAVNFSQSGTSVSQGIGSVVIDYI